MTISLIDTQSNNFDPVNGYGSNNDYASENPNTNTSTDYEESNTVNESSSLPLDNELHRFSSYNYIFTLFCLNKYEINFPDSTYRVKDPETVILRSGGGLKNKVYTAYEREQGKVEYFVDNVEIKSLIAPNPKTKQSNAVKISFDVTEPYSLGLFLQSLQRAAKDAGHDDYLDAPYLLTVDFVGYDTDGNTVTQLETSSLRRMFPLNFIHIDFSASEGGSLYNIRAIPWHEQAFLDQHQSIKTDCTVEGITLHDLCQLGGRSLSTIFNSRQQYRKSVGELKAANEYIILFPKENDLPSGTGSFIGTSDQISLASASPLAKRSLSAAEKQQLFVSISGSSVQDMPPDFDEDLSLLLGVVVKRSEIGEILRNYANDASNLNEIGVSTIVDGFLDGRKQPFARPRYVRLGDKKDQFDRKRIQLTDQQVTLSFPSGTNLQDIVEELIILSDYGKKLAKPLRYVDKFGRVPWFKIDSRVYSLDSKEQVAKGGSSPKIFVYIVRPFMVQLGRWGVISNTNYGMSSLKDQCVKHYDYIYSGLNNDVLELNLEFNKAFFSALTGLSNTESRKLQNDSNKVAGESAKQDYKTNDGDISNLEVNPAMVNSIDTYRPTTGNTGGSFSEDPRVAIARDFNDAILNSDVDLIIANMTIQGDPYYISDSGMGNYESAKTEFINLNKDGTMNYEEGEVDILIRFKNPIDYKTDGYMEFGGLENSSFSGIYNVVGVTNKFSQGQFTQDLRMIRRRNQEGFDTITEEDLLKMNYREEFNEDAYSRLEDGSLASPF